MFFYEVRKFEDPLRPLVAQRFSIEYGLQKLPVVRVPGKVQVQVTRELYRSAAAAQKWGMHWPLATLQGKPQYSRQGVRWLRNSVCHDEPGARASGRE